jgi:hypothetical protein
MAKEVMMHYSGKWDERTAIVAERGITDFQ